MYKNKVVIIGGGIGGLFSGALLAKNGINVTVIEKNSTIGGGLQSYKRFNEIFDTGMHIVGGMHPDGNLYKICRYLGILDKIRTRDVDDICTDEVYIASEKKVYHIAKGRQGFIDSLTSYFPHQRCELERYVDAMYSLTEELDLFYLRASCDTTFTHSADFLLPVDQFISKYITDDKLKVVLSFQNLLYAGEAGITPAFIHAVISVLYINGPSRFVGGTYNFAELLANVITESGGTIIKGDAVSQIEIEHKSVSHCVTASGKIIKADYFISAIHPVAFNTLIKNESLLSKAYRDRINNIPNTYSALILNIKFKPNSIKYFNYTGHYFSQASDIWENPTNISRWPNICLYMTPPSHIQSEYASTMNIIAPMSWHEVSKWENTRSGNRSSDYLEWKRMRANRVIEILSEIFPDLPNSIDEMDISSPLSIRDYYGVKQGALYGYKKDCNNLSYSKISIRSKFPNLYFTGQNINLHGFCGVALTAIETSEMILGNNKIINEINSIN